jgi:hypothetical protein
MPITPKQINDALAIIKTAQRRETGSPEGGRMRFKKTPVPYAWYSLLAIVRGEILARPVLNGARYYSNAAAEKSIVLGLQFMHLTNRVYYPLV